MIFRFSFSFFFLWSCYLRWPPPLTSQNIWNFTVTYINRLHCTMVSAWGLIMTPTQTVCCSTETGQKADQTIALLELLTSAEAQSGSLWNQPSLLKGFMGQVLLPLHLYLYVPTRRGTAPQRGPCPCGFIRPYKAEEKGWLLCLVREEMNVARLSSR